MPFFILIQQTPHSCRIFQGTLAGNPPPRNRRVTCAGRPVDLSWAHRANDERPRVQIKAIGVSDNDLDRPGGPLFAIRQITGLFYFKEPTLFLRFISRNLTIPA